MSMTWKELWLPSPRLQEPLKEYVWNMQVYNVTILALDWHLTSVPDAGYECKEDEKRCDNNDEAHNRALSGNG